MLYRKGRAVHAWVHGIEIDGDWTACLRLALQRGRVVVSEMRVFPRRDGQHDMGEWAGSAQGLLAQVPIGGLTSRLLRRVPVHEHLRFTGDLLRHLKHPSTLQYGRGAKNIAKILGVELGRASSVTTRPAVTTARRGGRPPTPEDVLLAAAATYSEAVAKRRHPVQTTAKKLRVTLGRARDLIHRARLRGLLTPVPQGRGGGELTARARALLLKVERRKARRTR
jgi:hypothetical protein